MAVRVDDQLPPVSLALVRCQPELLDSDPPGRFGEVMSPCRKAQAARARGVTGGPQQGGSRAGFQSRRELLMWQRSLCHQLVGRLGIGTSSRSKSGTDRRASYR